MQEATLANNKIALLFWEKCPSSQAGKCIEFCATNKKFVWKGGRDSKHSDPELVFENCRLISRIHFTLYFHEEKKKWYIVDGGVYADGQVVQPSSNGVRVKKTNKWERIGGQTEIEPGVLIWLGPGVRIVVTADCSNTTLGQFYWLDSNWPIARLNEPPKVKPSIEKELVQQSNITGWAVLLDLLNWVQERPRDRMDLVYKLIIVFALVQTLTIIGIFLYFWKIHPHQTHNPESPDRVQVGFVHDQGKR